MLGSQTGVIEEVSFKVIFKTPFSNLEAKISLNKQSNNSLIRQGEFILQKFKLMCVLLTTTTQVTAHNRDPADGHYNTLHTTNTLDNI